MLNNKQQMDLLKQAVKEDYKGSIADLMEGIPPEGQQENVEVAETPQEQEQGLSGRAPQQLPDAMVFPESQGDFNTNNMQAPIDIEKYGRQGELVQSYKSVPPGIGNLPMGDDVGTVIERPAEYQTKGVKYQGMEVLPFDKVDDLNLVDPLDSSKLPSRFPGEEEVKETFSEKARRARMMRQDQGEYYPGQSEGTVSTHLMATYEADGKYYVAPTITNKGTGEYRDQSFQEAVEAGEAISFDTQKEADAFAKGSWKLPTITDQYKCGGFFKDVKVNTRKKGGFFNRK